MSRGECCESSWFLNPPKQPRRPEPCPNNGAEGPPQAARAASRAARAAISCCVGVERWEDRAACAPWMPSFERWRHEVAPLKRSRLRLGRPVAASVCTAAPITSSGACRTGRLQCAPWSQPARRERRSLPRWGLDTTTLGVSCESTGSPSRPLPASQSRRPRLTSGRDCGGRCCAPTRSKSTTRSAAESNGGSHSRSGAAFGMLPAGGLSAGAVSASTSWRDAEMSARTTRQMC